SILDKQYWTRENPSGKPMPNSESNHTNSISIDEFYYNASKKTSNNHNSNNNSSTNSSLYQHHLRRLANNNSTIDSNIDTSSSTQDRHHHRHNTDLTSMTTDDETSSTASFRQRSRKLSKAGSVTSPLGGASSFSALKNSSSNALSTFSFLSSSDRTNTTSSVTDATKTVSQLRVRHLEQQSIYAGYLTKFSSRTFFSRKQWKRRYFILSDKSLYCFKSSDPQHPLLESIALSPEAIVCVTDEFSGKRYCIEISSPGEKSWYVLADTASEMSGWLKELKNALQHIRSTPITRPETVYSDASEVSDFSGITSATRIPNVPAIPSQYDYLNGASRSLPGTLSSIPSSLPRQAQQQHNLDSYQGQVASLNPPPRPISPKPSASMPGSSPLNSQGNTQNQPYRTSPQMQPQQPQQLESRRRRNSSVSTVQQPSDYASFGSVMKRAEAMAEAQKESQSSSWSIPTKAEISEGNYATLPRSKRESVMSTMSDATITSTTSTITPRTYGMSPPTDTMAIPHRNVQRLAGASRPVSAMSSRPQSPTLSRSSPRNSLVIAPPPRSALRPASVSIRHSTQILPHPQIATVGLPSRYSIANSPITSSPPTSSLPAIPSSSESSSQTGSLSRITSIRLQRDSGSNRHSMISTTSALSSPSSSTGSIQERVQRSPSRTSVMRSMAVSTGGLPLKPAAPSDLLGMNRPLSPTPSLSAAPTLPLPEPPGSNSSPSSSIIGSTYSTPPVSSLPSSPTIETLRRVSTVPRHHEPDLPIPNRSKARVRSQSQEAALISAKLEELQLSQGTNSPSPKLKAAPTSSKNQSIEGNKVNLHSRQMSLPINTMYALPEPPTGQVPPQPSAQASPSSPRPLIQRSSGSSTSLRPLSSSMNNVASLGGGIARRPSTSNNTASKRNSLVSPRSSTLTSLPPGPTTTMPLPPKSALPAPPTSALPKNPAESKKKSEKKVRIAQSNTQAGFDAIIEEEEDDDPENDEDEDDHDHDGNDDDNDDDDEDEEYESHLQFEELEAAKEATEQELDTESTATTPTTATRPEYYATKESKVVEYIFPSESFSS
ncbi:hypothetical protein BGZ49_009125, partial [Haplosporangium sp. Z 27]